MKLRYCKICNCETRHRKLNKTGFFMQCLIAAISSFKADLREPDLECNNCGNQVNS